MSNRQGYETVTVETADEWRTTGVFLVALFVGGGVLLVGWGIWDLLSSDAAQHAFAAAITATGYGLTALLVLVGLGGLAYGLSFLMKSMAPFHLSQGVREHGGVFRSDGVVVTLPEGFQELPEGTQKEIIAALIDVRREERKRLAAGVVPETDGGDVWRNAIRTRN